MKRLPPTILVIFGITGDLAKRKLLPSLYDLVASGKLSKSIKIIGVTRRGTTVKQVESDIRSSVEARGDKCDHKTLKFLSDATQIIKMDITAISEYAELKKQLDAVETDFGVCMNRLFYLAIPAQMFIPIVELLGRARLNSGCQHQTAESRLLIEKPIGYDLASAQELIDIISHHFTSKQTYLIDHYLVKSGVESITNFRFKNGQLEQQWNNQHISHISIIACEKIGIEGRTIFYEQMGAMRDFVQSHLMQTLALITMEKPKNNSVEAIHEAKAKLLTEVKPPTPDLVASSTVRGQYDSYKSEVGNPSSEIETFAALIVKINNQRWQNVPILIATGKKLVNKKSQARIKFKDQRVKDLIFEIDPKSAIKINGEVITRDYQETDAYEHVMAATLEGDKSLFADGAEVIASWKVVQPVLNAWSNGIVPIEIYKSGSAGPKSFERLISKFK